MAAADLCTLKMDITNNNRVVVSTTRVTVQPENRKEFFQTITPLMRRIRTERGCLAFSLYEETEDENALFLVGEWLTENSWSDHRDGENFAVLHGSVMVLTVRSKIDFKLLGQIGGIERIPGS